MKPPRTPLKAAVAGCSALLIAGFVSYRAGAFDSYLRPAPAPVEPEPTPAADAAPQNPQVTKVTDPTVFSSSKSIILTPVTSTPGGSKALPGSKSAAVFTPDLDIPVRKPEPKAEPAAPASPPK